MAGYDKKQCSDHMQGSIGTGDFGANKLLPSGAPGLPGFNGSVGSAQSSKRGKQGGG